MRRNLLVLVLIAACSTYPPPEAPKQPPARDLWQMCWSESFPMHPSDYPPHKPHCDDPEPIKYDHLPIRVAIGPNMERWRRLVYASMQMWNDAVGFEILAFGDDPDIAIVKGGERPGIWGVALHAREEERIVCAIVLFEGSEGPYFYWVLSHELGHALGLAHDIDSPGSIMHKGEKPQAIWPRIMPNDAEALKRLYRLTPRSPKRRPPSLAKPWTPPSD